MVSPPILAPHLRVFSRTSSYKLDSMSPPSISVVGLNAYANSTDSSSHTSGSIPQQNSGSEEDPRIKIDERKQKRMLSNRESARRSRMRKQQHLDELRGQAAHLIAENNHIHTKFNITSQSYLQLQEENSVLRSHAMDLSLKLQSLNVALQWAEGLNGLDLDTGFLDSIPMATMDMKPWYMPSISQPLTAAQSFQ
eukprot:Gb_29784 [translate_table: standard]